MKRLELLFLLNFLLELYVKYILLHKKVTVLYWAKLSNTRVFTEHSKHSPMFKYMLNIHLKLLNKLCTLLRCQFTSGELRDGILIQELIIQKIPIYMAKSNSLLIPFGRKIIYHPQMWSKTVSAQL